MHEQNKLQNMYDGYKAGSLTRHDFEGRLFQHLLANAVQYRIFPKDESRWNEFVSCFYPRLSRAIDLYRDIGASFDQYISGLIYNGAKEYRGRETARSITEYSCWQARSRELAACESSPEYGASSDSEAGERPALYPAAGRERRSISPRINRKHILLLLLKSYYFVSDEFTAQVARAIGMDPRKVKAMITELKRRRDKKEHEIHIIRDRLFSQYYRYLSMQERLNAAVPGSVQHEKMSACLERARKRLWVIKGRFRKMRRDAPNRLISEVTGIPKGTVDSGLFHIKRQFAEKMDGAIKGKM
jgi:predicted transcriptional regulator with HTH domain